MKKIISKRNGFRRKPGQKEVKTAWRENLFRTMLDAIPQLAWIARPDGSIYWYNRRWHDYTHTTLEQMNGDGWASVHDPALLPSVMKRWRSCLASGKPFEFELPLKGADGNFRWFLTRCHPLKDANGKVLRWFGTNTDLSLKRESEIQASWLSAIVSSSDDAIIGKNLQGMISSWNEGARRLFGYSAREAVGRSILFLIPPDRQQEEKAILAQIASGKHIDHYETVRLRKDGSKVQVSLTVSPIKDASGKIIGASKIARNIGDRLKGEQQLRAANSALLESEKQILAVSEQERRHIGADLHDNLGQQLMAIELLCNSLRADLGMKPQLQSRIKRICRLLQSAVSHTRQLSHGLMPVSLDAEGLSDALKKMVLQMRRGFTTCEFICTSAVKIEDKLVADHLFHIAQEALKNAAKHSGASDILTTLSRQNGLIMLKIEDNGRGLPKSRRAGSGVGLQIMRHRANVIGASLEIKSTRGKGACVTCTLKERT